MTAPLLDLPRVIAHRGASRYAPENTLAALRKANELGIKWAEFDVMLTADAVPIVIHDETLQRTTNGKGLVANTTYAEIASLDAGSWFDARFTGEKIPTFAQFLQYCAQIGMGINVEIKPAKHQDKATAIAVIETLRQQDWLSRRQQLVVSSFSVTSLMAARALDDTVNLGLLLDRWVTGWQDVVKQLRCVSVNTNYRMLNPEKVAAIKNLGCYVLAYTVDDPELAHKLFAWGVDAVFSNVPDVIQHAIITV